MPRVFSAAASRHLTPRHRFYATIGLFLLCLVPLDTSATGQPTERLVLPQKSGRELRFNKNGEFKILQVADMHYADGILTPCLDVDEEQALTCTDLNTTAFIERLIQNEKPDLIVFTGDNIYGNDSSDPEKSLNAAFAPAIAAGIPWAAVLGNHDDEGSLSKKMIMEQIAGMDYSVSRVNPPGESAIDGFGNYNLEVGGVKGSTFENKSVLNLYFLDSGSYSTNPIIQGYDWVKLSQQLWFRRISAELQEAYKKEPEPQELSAPALAYFHIPLPEFGQVNNSEGTKFENISSASVNSGLFTTMAEAGDVKAIFTGHDHLNDFCGDLYEMHLCYAGGVGYHAYGMAGWPRRSRVVLATLEKTEDGGWGGVQTIRTWKRLDDEDFSKIDEQILWSKIDEPPPTEQPLVNLEKSYETC